MIISMTGFGRAEGSHGNLRYRVEITSVNSRYLEVSLRCPRRLLSREYELRELLRKKSYRGKLNVFIGTDSDRNTSQESLLSEEKIAGFLKLARRVNKIIGSNEEVKLADILEMAEYASMTDESAADDKEIEFVGKLLLKAAEDMSRMKVKEGKHLESDMLARIRRIDKEAKRIAVLSKKRAPAEFERIRKKLESILSSKTDLDVKRLETEIAMLADRYDITEELTRLKSHTKFFVDYARSDELAGRRLNFLAQEMNREINTVASKSSDAEISQITALLKEELEKIREQLQNVE